MMRTQYFYYNGIDSREYGIYLTSAIKIGGAQPNVEKISIPGRNGNLLHYDGSYSNVAFPAECVISGSQANDAIAAIAQWASGNPGYHRLEFPWEDGFRMAHVVAGPGIEALADGVRTFTLEFECMPQVFTYDGQQPIVLRESTKLHNKWMEALPLITIYGLGSCTINIGDKSITTNGMKRTTTLDCELQNAYDSFGDANDVIYAPEMPTLPHGDTLISWSGSISKIEITPRWWHL